MKKVFVTGICFILLAVTSIVQAQCIIDKSNWSLVFNDEFSGTTSDLTNNWYFEYTYGPVHSPGSSWFETFNTPSNVSVSGGYAYINTYKTPTTYGGITYDYSSAILRSKFADYQICDPGTDADKSGFLYGMFEVRCKLPGKAGQSPAFWLTGNNAWPPEIDVFEFNGSNHNEIFSSVHYPYGGGSQGASNYYNYPTDLTNEFHTYNVVWTPTKITWFIDGRELKSDNITAHLPGTAFTDNFNRCMWSKMDIILQNALNWPNSWETSFDPFIIDYVRVYRPTALPAYTTQNFDDYFDYTLFPTYAATQYKSSVDWNLTKVVAPTDSYNANASLNVLQNGGKYYYRGDYNLLWTTYWYDYGSGGQYYATPLDWYHTIDGNISISSPDIYTEIPFFRTGAKVEYYQGGFYEIATYPDPGINSSSPALFSDANGLQVLFLGTDNNLWLYYRTSTSSHTWAKNQITFTGTVSSQIAIAPGGFYNAFYRDAYNQLVQVYFTDSYSSSTVISTVSDVNNSISVNSTGDVVYYRTQYGELYYYTSNYAGWTRSAFTAVYPWSSGTPWQVYNIASDIQVGENPSQIYYLGTDNRVWVLYYDGTNWQATAIHWTIDYSVRDLRISEPYSSSRRLSFVGPDNQIRYFNYDYCEVLNPTAGATTTFSVKPQIVKPMGETAPAKPAELKIWPNPVGAILTFSASQFIGENVIITIFDSKGQKLVQQSKTINAETQTIQLPNMAQAMYYLQVVSKKQSAAAKFIKKE